MLYEANTGRGLAACLTTACIIISSIIVSCLTYHVSSCIISHVSSTENERAFASSASYNSFTPLLPVFLTPHPEKNLKLLPSAGLTGLDQKGLGIANVEVKRRHLSPHSSVLPSPCHTRWVGLGWVRGISRREDAHLRYTAAPVSGHCRRCRPLPRGGSYCHISSEPIPGLDEAPPHRPERSRHRQGHGTQAKPTE